MGGRAARFLRASRGRGTLGLGNGAFGLLVFRCRLFVLQPSGIGPWPQSDIRRVLADIAATEGADRLASVVDTLSNRLRELAFLNRGLKIVIEDERDGRTHTFLYKGGIIEFIKHLNQNKTPLHPKVLFFEGKKGVTELSKFPTKDEAIAQVVTLVVSPAKKLMAQIKGPGATVAGMPAFPAESARRGHGVE